MLSFRREAVKKEVGGSRVSYLPTAEGMAALAAAFCLQHCHVLVDHATKRWIKLLGQGPVRIAFNAFLNAIQEPASLCTPSLF